MKPITDWLRTELYPTLYQNLDIALPEFNFKMKGKYYVSSNRVKITGEEGNTRGKVYVYENNPSLIKDYTRGNVTLIDYIIERDKVDFIVAVKKLAELVNLKLPETKIDEELFREYRQKTKLIEEANYFFIQSLHNPQETRAVETKKYLSTRGYTEEDIEFMELGYIGDYRKLYNYLQSKGFTETYIDKELTLKLDNRIGSTHNLTIPYRSGGVLKGFKFRSINEDKPKYINTTGLDRSGGFFNLSSLKGDKDLIIVEGELDCLIATARGIKNVVATGGSNINRLQIRDAIKKGAKSFTLCFDTEPDKAEITAHNLTLALEEIRKEGDYNVYIVILPDLGGGKTDPDKRIIKSGVEAFRQDINRAIPYWEFIHYQTLIKYGKKAEQLNYNGLLPQKETDKLLEEIVIIGSKLSPVNRDRFKNLFLNTEAIKKLGIKEDSLSIVMDKLTSSRDKEKQNKELSSLITKAQNFQKSGDTDKAINVFKNELYNIELLNRSSDFDKLLLPSSEELLKLEEANKPNDLNSGYKINDIELLLPAGAISVYAGATGHGKTLLAINTALNVLDSYPDKKFIFFTYEEKSSIITQYFLNVYINRILNKNPSQKGNRQIIKDYFRTGSTRYIANNELNNFKIKKDKFFKDYIETGRLLIKGVDYSYEELDLAIRYIHKRESNIGAVFIDYFQLLNLTPESKKTEKTGARQEELKVICQRLNKVAKDTGYPIILAAQFNREATDLTKLHPTNLSEAGDIERIVHTLIGIWQIGKAVVNKKIAKEDKPVIQEKIGGRETGIYIELIKSRELPSGLYQVLDYEGKTGKISNPKQATTEEEDVVF
jgi:DNA primase catalytic core